MTIQIIGQSTNIVETNSSKNVKTVEGIPTHDGDFTLSSKSTLGTILAASLTLNSTLAWIYFTGMKQAAYITSIRTLIGVATVGASGLVPGALSWQRFSYLVLNPVSIPIPNRQIETQVKSSMTSQIDTSAITMSNASFGTVVAWTRFPIFVSVDNMNMEWIYEPNYPTVLHHNDGLALRVAVAMPATQTWVYSYTVKWYEKS